MMQRTSLQSRTLMFKTLLGWGVVSTKEAKGGFEMTTLLEWGVVSTKEAEGGFEMMAFRKGL